MINMLRRHSAAGITFSAWYNYYEGNLDWSQDQLCKLICCSKIADSFRPWLKLCPNVALPRQGEMHLLGLSDASSTFLGVGVYMFSATKTVGWLGQKNSRLSYLLSGPRKLGWMGWWWGTVGVDSLWLRFQLQSPKRSLYLASVPQCGVCWRCSILSKAARLLWEGQGAALQGRKLLRSWHGGSVEKRSLCIACPT